jgi:hypothetical protein
MKDWFPITYRDFFDVPRAFVVERAGQLYFFDCPFSAEIDEYPNEYKVYELPPRMRGQIQAMSWSGLASDGRLIGTVPTSAVEFDETKRQRVSSSAFLEIRELS